MGAMILALAVVLIVGLLVLGLIIAERYPISTWSGGLRALGATARQKEEPVQVLPQDVSLDDLMVEGDTAVYTGTDSFSGLVHIVEKAMDTAESTTAGLRHTKAGTS
ncbi:hypothetical protein [Actinomyces oricola]